MEEKHDCYSEMDANTEDYLEIIYWEFDAEKKKGSFSERDLFKAKMRGLIRTIQNTRTTDARCKRDMRTRLVGDGCRYCNPQYYVDILEGQIEESATDPLLEKMAEALEFIAREAESFQDRTGKEVSWLNMAEEALQEYLEKCK